MSCNVPLYAVVSDVSQDYFDYTEDDTVCLASLNDCLRPRELKRPGKGCFISGNKMRHPTNMESKWLHDRDWPQRQCKNLQHVENFDMYSNPSIKWEVRWCYKGLSFPWQICHVIVWEYGVASAKWRGILTQAQPEGYCKSSCRFKCQEDLHLHHCSRTHLSWELKPLRKMWTS